ncbi:hypothetical protein, partial [Tateyamaria sp.]|uniref:hypothetical protein n=1 Tax=Tateyamaria sp. TaxID=1929288 RepID=UPI00329E0C02
MLRTLMLFFWLACIGVVLAAQYYAVANLEEPFFPSDWPRYQFDYWISAFRPQTALVTMLILFSTLYIVTSLRSGLSNRMGWVFPSVFVLMYLIFLSLFYFTERVHYGTEFKIGVAYVDPFKVFQIPLIYSTPFSMICAMVLY